MFDIKKCREEYSELQDFATCFVKSSEFQKKKVHEKYRLSLFQNKVILNLKL